MTCLSNVIVEEIRKLDNDTSNALNETCFTQNTEMIHSDVDDVLCNALRAIGLVKTVETFKNVKKWCS